MGFCLKTHLFKIPKDNSPSTLCQISSRLRLEFLLPFKSNVLWDTQMAIAWSSRWPSWFLVTVWLQASFGACAHRHPIHFTLPLLPAAAGQPSTCARPSGRQPASASCAWPFGTAQHSARHQHCRRFSRGRGTEALPGHTDSRAHRPGSTHGPNPQWG